MERGRLYRVFPKWKQLVFIGYGLCNSARNHSKAMIVVLAVAAGIGVGSGIILGAWLLQYLDEVSLRWQQKRTKQK
jgi:hypothetical protein